jgi:hypothetical protein
MNKRERLARLIAKGKLHYIWVHGVLGWGLATATMVAAWELMQHVSRHNPWLLATPVFAFLSFVSQWPGAPEQGRWAKT